MSIAQKKILFLSRALERGGAERQLVLLTKGLTLKRWPVTVATFYKGEFDSELVSNCIPVHCLQKRGRWDVLLFICRLILLIRQEKPAILHSYLAVANILAVLIKAFSPKMKIVWGIRASDMDLSRYDWLERFISQLEQYLARWADLIIVNSQAGYRHLITRQFPRSKIITIYNGIDIRKFSPNDALRKKLRLEWGIQEDEILIGLVARIDPMKDHPTFLQAALSTAQQNAKLRFVCVGNGSPEYVSEMKNLAAAQMLGSRLIWSEARDDMAAVYNSLDIAVSSSITEGFSNSIGEAMACGVSCIVTDVGDSSNIVGSVGIVVPARNPVLLAEAILSVARGTLPEKNIVRHQIAENFSIETLFIKTEQALSQLL